jgi:hypothetical protein
LPATLRIPATLAALEPAEGDARCGLAVRYEPRLLRHGPEPLRDFLDLSAPLSLDSARGLAQLTRLLRAARLAARGPVERWLGDPAGAHGALRGALGRSLVLTAAPRSCVRFTAWTDERVHTLDFVSDVIADDAGFSVRCMGMRPSAFFPRAAVLRHETTTRRWLEVVSIAPR